ncbi:hypothetical protein TREMEDRAFT_60170 [Tremella mesenterica DSM 1558]|uniref:uncharacterized protein n=1 Tax=Tremella mesenterica (strain ATCC 24925 / CBS 8224 / DSM 1558 / NBRC 9311 / NRRL Y-6157 / RJB 2259-6 / UBC 559-6) TaxID=578456 RepID=UPI0003F493CD|nr:uncharacterized protein TREMEDRAFT_60170 [Tremella mesenterica DSM 1558]EIW71235.1 hypothetical protein TREMEDRAFT_60170 [Tremella mesenterica DSM 1558]
MPNSNENRKLLHRRRPSRDSPRRPITPFTPSISRTIDLPETPVSEEKTIPQLKFVLVDPLAASPWSITRGNQLLSPRPPPSPPTTPISGPLSTLTSTPFSAVLPATPLTTTETPGTRLSGRSDIFQPSWTTPRPAPSPPQVSASRGTSDMCPLTVGGWGREWETVFLDRLHNTSSSSSSSGQPSASAPPTFSSGVIRDVFSAGEDEGVLASFPMPPNRGTLVPSTKGPLTPPASPESPDGAAPSRPYRRPTVPPPSPSPHTTSSYAALYKSRISSPTWDLTCNYEDSGDQRISCVDMEVDDDEEREEVEHLEKSVWQWNSDSDEDDSDDDSRTITASTPASEMSRWSGCFEAQQATPMKIEGPSAADLIRDAYLVSVRRLPLIRY